MLEGLNFDRFDMLNVYFYTMQALKPHTFKHSIILVLEFPVSQEYEHAVKVKILIGGLGELVRLARPPGPGT